jgi:hypothetical protein
VFSESGEVSHTCSAHWVCWRIITSMPSPSPAQEPLAICAVRELTDGNLTVVLFEVATQPVSSAASFQRFPVGGRRRHAYPVAPRLAENLEVKL